MSDAREKSMTTKTAMFHNGRNRQWINDYILNLNFKRFITLFFVLFSMGLAYSFPIWLADRTYIDDLGRSLGGYTQWEIAGRPFASWLTSIANFQYPWNAWSGVPPKLPGTALLVDTSPFLQILSVAMLASASALLGCIILGDAAIYTIAFVVFPIIGSPFLLENLSYKFDALSMATALAISIAAAINLRNKLLDLVIGTVLLIIAYGLYQPSVNAFIGTSALLILAELWNKKVFVANIAYLNITKFAIATVIYQIGILSLFAPTTPYVIYHSQLIPITTEGLAILANNVTAASADVVEFFSDIPLLSILGIVSVVVFGARVSWEGRTRERIINFGVFVVSATILTLSICGILLFLRIPLFLPRTFMGFTIFLVFLLFSFTAGFSHYRRVVSVCLVFPIYYLYFLAFAYGAAAKSQTEYDYTLASSIIQALDSLGFRSENVLVFDGTQPNSPVLENSQNIKIIKRLVPLYINNQWAWGYFFMRYQGLQFTQLASNPTNSEISRFCKSAPVLVTERYKIYRDNETFIVAFENGACFQTTPMK